MDFPGGTEGEDLKPQGVRLTNKLLNNIYSSKIHI